MSLTVPKTTSDTVESLRANVNKVEISRLFYEFLWGNGDVTAQVFWVDRDTFNALPA